MNLSNIECEYFTILSFILGFILGCVFFFSFIGFDKKNDEGYEGFKKLDGKLPKAPVPICQCGGTVPLTRKFKSSLENL